MINMSFADIKVIAKIGEDWSYQETNMFMSWLKKHPSVKYDVVEENFNIHSIDEVKEYIHLFNHRPIFVSDVFSLNMLQGDNTIKTVEIDLKSVMGIIEKRNPFSHISNQYSAAVVNGTLGKSLVVNSEELTLGGGDDLIVAQNLSDGNLKFILVTIK